MKTDTIRTPVRQCARCGQNHRTLAFKKLARPAGVATHWASCPRNGQPILMYETQSPPRPETGENVLTAFGPMGL